METANRLREIRKELNITQEEMARRLEEPLQYINKVESGAILLHKAIMIKLNQRLGINLNWLLCGEGNMLQSRLDSNLNPY